MYDTSHSPLSVMHLCKVTKIEGNQKIIIWTLIVERSCSKHQSAGSDSAKLRHIFSRLIIVFADIFQSRTSHANGKIKPINSSFPMTI